MFGDQMGRLLRMDTELRWWTLDHGCGGKVGVLSARDEEEEEKLRDPNVFKKSHRQDDTVRGSRTERTHTCVRMACPRWSSSN